MVGRRYYKEWIDDECRAAFREEIDAKKKCIERETRINRKEYN